MTPDAPLPDHVQRMLDALCRSRLRARRVAAQTGTRMIVVRDGRIVAEPVPPSEAVAPRAPGDGPASRAAP